MKREKFIEELKSIKEDCTESYKSFVELRKSLKKIQKKADRLVSEMNRNEDLYVVETVQDSEGHKREWQKSNGWNYSMMFRCMDLMECLPDAIETIDNCLYNIKTTSMKG